MEIKKMIADRSNYGASRNLGYIKYIVIHYTANDGDAAWNNANYFQKTKNIKASAHYFVDDKYIYESVPVNYSAYAVGSKTVDRSKGGGTFYGICTNDNSISIELCDTNKNHVIYPTEATIQKAIELCMYLMDKFDIDPDHVIRHFDVTGKQCPAYWVENGIWEAEFHSKISVGSEIASLYNNE